MASDFSRGIEDSPSQFAVLQEKWPRAFPVKPHDVRPLTVGAADEIAVAMGWPVSCTAACSVRWKMGPVYCRAVICSEHRIALDGTPAEPVDADAKELATKQLAALAARRAAKVKPAKPAKPARAPQPLASG